MRVSSSNIQPKDTSIAQKPRAAAVATATPTESFVKSESAPIKGRAFYAAALSAGAAGVAYCTDSLLNSGGAGAHDIVSTLVGGTVTAVVGGMMGLAGTGLAQQVYETVDDDAMFHTYTREENDLGMLELATGTAAGAGAAVLGFVFGASPVATAVIAGTLAGATGIAMTMGGSAKKAP